MDWHAVLPREEAIRQLGWERRQLVVRLREHGLTLKEVGLRLGVGAERVRQILLKEERMRKHPRYRPPVQAFFDETDDLRRLAAMQRGPGTSPRQALEHQAAAVDCRHWCYDEKRCRCPWYGCRCAGLASRQRAMRCPTAAGGR